MDHTSLVEERLSEMSQDLILKEDDHDTVQEFHEDEEDEGEEEEEEEFSFSLAFDGANMEQISAEEAFDNGQIKPVFPLFNRDLVLVDGIDLDSLKLNDRVPNVKKVFLETNDLPSTTGDDEAVGPYCEWSKKAVEAEAAPEGCKKSNSTGFSKIWRFRDLMHRCNSDGRDAFVFLNNNNNSSSAPASGKREDRVAGGTDKKDNFTEKTSRTPERKVNGEVVGEGKLKKLLKSKKPAPSPHEVYLKSKAKDGRRSYLPYRPELVGFFTNVNGGGLTRNVHPF